MKILFHRISPFRCHRLTDRNKVRYHPRIMCWAPNFHQHTKSKGHCNSIFHQVLKTLPLLTTTRGEILVPRSRLCSWFLSLKSAALVWLSQSNQEIHNYQPTVVTYNRHQGLSIPRKIFSGPWLGIDQLTFIVQSTTYKVDPTKIRKESKLWDNKVKHS